MSPWKTCATLLPVLEGCLQLSPELASDLVWKSGVQIESCPCKEVKHSQNLLDFFIYNDWEDFKSEATANNGMNSVEGDIVVLGAVGKKCRIFLTQRLEEQRRRLPAGM